MRKNIPVSVRICFLFYVLISTRWCNCVPELVSKGRRLVATGKVKYYTDASTMEATPLPQDTKAVVVVVKDGVATVDEKLRVEATFEGGSLDRQTVYLDNAGMMEHSIGWYWFMFLYSLLHTRTKVHARNSMLLI